jgi:RNA polymerase primary sigma factor
MTHTDQRWWQSHGHAPNLQELSAALSWTPAAVEDLLITVQPMVQLQQPITDDGTALQDILEDTQTPQPDMLVAAEQVRRGVRACLGHLTEREALIVRLRYGLDAYEPHSLQDIGTSLASVGGKRAKVLDAKDVLYPDMDCITEVKKSNSRALKLSVVCYHRI